MRPVEALAHPAIRLLLVSSTLLFTELLMIRWIPANVIYVGFFRNFILMASFLGIGLGILWGRAGRRPAYSLFGPLLLAIAILVVSGRVTIAVNTTGEIFFGLSESQNKADINFLVLPAMVALVAFLMAMLAVPLGDLLKSMPPLRAYRWDILGSMAGIAAFTALSAAGTPPPVWFGVLAVLLALGGLAVGLNRGSVVTAAGVLATLIVVVAALPANQVWSPYYRIDLYDTPKAEALAVNGIPHQAMWPMEAAEELPFYTQVYRWFPGRTYENVLVVGAGSGTDVAVALKYGAGHVDAVEIDPTIQQIGRERHPEQPYSDPRVTAIVYDGRAFLSRTTKRYDLVVFALPDSLTLVSTSANLRLESFLFTTESFASVRDHLTDNGVFVLYNYYREDWLPEKIGGMLRDAFGTQPAIRHYGEAVATLAAGPAIAAVNGTPPGDAFDDFDVSAAPRPATDDWPFLYLREPGIAAYYVAAIAIVLAFALLLVWRGARASGTSLRRFSPHFFLLGVAFLLLETRSLVTFSLLFGSTWLVNSLVFFAVLASVLLAIAVNSRYRIRNPMPLYVALLVSILVAWLLPADRLLLEPSWLRYLVASVVTFAPIFLANLVFSHSFGDTWTADMAFAVNLLGAMVGGAIEYVALITGYQALLVVVGVLYALAFLAATQVRLLADADLVDERTSTAGREALVPDA